MAETRKTRIVATMGPATHSAENIRQLIAAAARACTEQQRVAAICVFTLSGETARLVAPQRPRVPILAFTPSQETPQKMAPFW